MQIRANGPVPERTGQRVAGHRGRARGEAHVVR